MTFHEFLKILKTAKVSQHKFFRVHGRSAAASGKKWAEKGVVPAWVERHVYALVEVPGYRDYILDQDLEKIKDTARHGNPNWIKCEKKHNDNAV